MISIDRCPVCNSTTFLPFLTCQDHSISQESFSIIRCNVCELLITSPRPDPDKLGAYYLSPAYTSHISAAKNFVDKIYLYVRNFTLKWKISLLEKNTSSSSHKQLLDFGCGTGEFLKAAKSQGWSTTGMEPSAAARQHADTTVASDIKTSITEVANERKKFDIITLWHVLEHVEDPNATLQSLKDLLHENGTIFIAVPNHTSWDGKHYQHHWAAYDVPRHLWHFHRKSMNLLLQKHALNLVSIIPMRLDAFYVSLLSEKYRRPPSASLGMFKAFFAGLRSNYMARNSMEYSSLIYVVKK